jgi:hypothetical protein
LQHAPFRPLNDMYRQLVYAEPVAGETCQVIGAGKIMTFAEQQLYREAEDLKQKILSRGFTHDEIQ